MMHGWGWGGHWIGMVLWWVLIFGVIAFAFRGFSGRCCGKNYVHRDMSGRSAVDILKERYAKGEITKEEYQDMKNNLE